MDNQQDNLVTPSGQGPTTPSVPQQAPTTPVAPAPQPIQPVSQPKSKKKKLLIIVIVLIVIAALVVGFLFYNMTKEKAAAQKRADEIVATIQASKSDSSQIRDLVFEDMGFSETETNQEALTEIAEISATCGLLANAQELTLKDESYGTTPDGRKLLTQTYDVKLSDTQSVEITATIEVVQEDDGEWELNNIYTTPGIMELAQMVSGSNQ